MEILRPTLLLNKQKCIANISAMAKKAKKHQLNFRPHFKTHQSAEVGQWYKDFGVNSITVSSVKMAEFFSKHGWNDITIAFPVNVREIMQINRLAEKVKLNILVTNIKALQYIKTKLKQNIGAFIKIDTGYKRAGIPTENYYEIDEILFEMSKNKLIEFKGFLSHDGHTYSANSKMEILEIRKQTNSQLQKLKDKFKANYPNLITSIGDTPSCSISDDFDGIDEIRPGNFVFYDVMQMMLGSCLTENIAVALACPVVDKRNDRNEIVVYGGEAHLSKEYMTNKANVKFFGLPVLITEKGWSRLIKNSYVSSLSQEHGVIKLSKIAFDAINIGDLIGILPIHSCLTANLMKDSTVII
ncbi:MAG: alanine racemase [Saprospiraceae bacterium]|nr:alanine racemase [Saprospiraceae bacterium]